MLNRKQKQELIDELAQKFKDAKSAVFADYKGLKVSQIKELRRLLKPLEAEFKVAKKTLIDLSLKKADIKEASVKEMSGQIGLALGFGDEVSAAKTIDKFARKNEGLKILGAILEGKFLGENEARALAKVPSREQSLGRLVGVLSAPLSGLVSVLGGNLRGLVFVLSAIKK